MSNEADLFTLIGPYELFSTQDPPAKPLPGYVNSDERWTWDDVRCLAFYIFVFRAHKAILQEAAWQERVKKEILAKELADIKE
jgi:hypothetical protein